MADPLTLFGDDSRPNTRPIYCYIITQVDVADVPPLFLTGHDGEVLIANMPAKYDADSPQAFSPANIAHGAIRRESNFDKSAFEVRALTQDIAGISRYALTGAVPRIRVEVIKVNPGRVQAGDAAQWDADTLLVQRGLMSSFGFQGFTVVVEVVPESLFAGHDVPRWRFSRTCNRQLYGLGCGVNPEGYTLATNILALDPGTRSMLVQDTHPEETGNFFRQGVLMHQPTGMRLSVFSSQAVGPNTRLTLHQWSPDLAVNDVVTIRAGCRHTFDDCRHKFDNAHRFGGFSEVPNKNPTIHGV